VGKVVGDLKGILIGWIVQGESCWGRGL
jgi:hypothetical protein